MDSTRARVEVCNASTYSASTKCELQVPTNWSDTSITATLKKGYLGAGTAYVYVINPSGKVNATGLRSERFRPERSRPPPSQGSVIGWPAAFTPPAAFMT